MSDKTTVFQAAGVNYAIHGTPADVLKLAGSNDFLKLQDGDDTLWIRGSTITTVSSWALPTHHGRIFRVTASGKQQSRND